MLNDLNFTEVSSFGSVVFFVICIVCVIIRYAPNDALQSRDGKNQIVGPMYGGIRRSRPDEAMFFTINDKPLMTLWESDIALIPRTREVRILPKGRQIVPLGVLEATTQDGFNIIFGANGDEFLFIMELVNPSLMKKSPNRYPRRALQHLIPARIAELVQDMDLPTFRALGLARLRQLILQEFQPVAQSWGASLLEFTTGQYDLDETGQEIIEIAQRGREEAAANNSRREAVAAMIELMGPDAFAAWEAARLISEATTAQAAAVSRMRGVKSVTLVNGGGGVPIGGSARGGGGWWDEPRRPSPPSTPSRVSHKPDLQSEEGDE